MNFDREEGPPVELTADQGQVLEREIRTMVSGLMYLVEHAKENRPIDRELLRNILYINESGLGKLSELTGVECESQARIEQRFAEIRKANMRVHELERLMGESMSVEKARLALREMLTRVEHWWRHEGLGHVRDAHLNSWGSVNLELSCHLFGRSRLLHSDTPVTDKAIEAQWLESLRNRGFVLVSAAGRANKNDVVDCDQSRSALIAMVTEALPSAIVRNFENQMVRDTLVMRGATVSIDNLDDIRQLPAPTQE